MSLTTSITLKGISAFGIVLHSITLNEIETTILEFSKEVLYEMPRFFLIVKIFDPNNLESIVIKKKTEIPLPDKVIKNWDDVIDLEIRIEDDGTGKIVITSSFPGVKGKEINICQDLIPQYYTHFCYMYGWGQ